MKNSILTVSLIALITHVSCSLLDTESIKSVNINDWTGQTIEFSNNCVVDSVRYNDGKRRHNSISSVLSDRLSQRRMIIDGIVNSDIEYVDTLYIWENYSSPTARIQVYSDKGNTVGFELSDDINEVDGLSAENAKELLKVSDDCFSNFQMFPTTMLIFSRYTVDRGSIKTYKVVYSD